MLIRWMMCVAAVMVAMVSNVVRADDQWVVYEGKEGPGKGKHIVFISGDDEYRSEEACPMLAKILAVRHGFKCTVLFAIDPKSGLIKPDFQENIPGTEALKTADLMVMHTRFRDLPAEQMQPIVDYTNSGKPIIGLRTSTHAFNVKKGDSPFAKWTWTSKSPAGGWGQAVLGETWISHHGNHGSQSTRGVIEPKYADHPILKNATDIWGPTDVYGVKNLKDSDQVLVRGAILEGMKPTDKPIDGPKNNPMMPLVWTREYKGETGNTSKVICTTMGAATDLESEGLRRLVINSCFWSVGLEVPEKANVEYVGDYKPTQFGFGKYQKDLTPSGFKL